MGWDIINSTQSMSNLGTTALSANTVYHLVYTYDGSGLPSGVNFYINGAANATTTPVGSLTLNTINNSLSVSATVSGAHDVLPAGIADFRLFNAKLSATQAALLFSNGPV